jgi:hypothetical protein
MGQIDRVNLPKSLNRYNLILLGFLKNYPRKSTKIPLNQIHSEIPTNN